MALVLPQRGELDWYQPLNEALTTLDANITTVSTGAFTKAQADALYDAINTAANLIAQHSTANDPHGDRDWASTRFLALTGGTLSGPITLTNLVATGDVTASSVTLPPGTVTTSIVREINSPTVIDHVVWRAPYNCTVRGVYAYRVGGTGATVNALVNTSNLLPSDINLSSANTWVTGTPLQNTAVTAGQSIILSVRSVAGSPTAVTIQVDIQGV